MYHRSRRVGIFLVAVIVCGATGSFVARSLPVVVSIELILWFTGQNLTKNGPLKQDVLLVQLGKTDLGIWEMRF